MSKHFSIALFFALASVGTVCNAVEVPETFSNEVIFGFAKTNRDNGSSSSLLFAIGHYFEEVEYAQGPIRESLMLNPSSGFGVAFSKTQADSDEFFDIPDLDSRAVLFEAVDDNGGYVGLGYTVAEQSYLERKTISIEAGLYGKSSKTSFGFERTSTDLGYGYDYSETILGFRHDHLILDDGGTAFGVIGDFESVLNPDAEDDTVVNLSAGVKVYPNKRNGFSVIVTSPGDEKPITTLGYNFDTVKGFGFGASYAIAQENDSNAFVMLLNLRL